MQLSQNIERHFHTYLIVCVSILSLGTTLWLWPFIFGKSLTYTHLDHVIILPLLFAVMLSNRQPRIPKYWIYLLIIVITSQILTLYGFLRNDNNSMIFQLPFILFFNSLIPSETDYVFSGIKLTPDQKYRYKEGIVKSLTNFLTIVVVLVIDHKLARSLWTMDPHSIVVADFAGLFLSAFILLLVYRLLKDRSNYIYLSASVLSVACLSMFIAMGSTYL